MTNGIARAGLREVKRTLARMTREQLESFALCQTYAAGLANAMSLVCESMLVEQLISSLRESGMPEEEIREMMTNTTETQKRLRDFMRRVN